MQVDMLRNILYAQAKKRDKYESLKENWFRASELGQCPRVIYYSRTGAVEKRAMEKNLFRLEDGSEKHERIQKDLKAVGILKKAEFLVTDEVNKIQGHPDGVIELNNRYTLILEDYIKRYILEIKTVGKWFFGMIKGGPALAHYKQANFYGINTGIKNIYFFYYCADNGKTKEFECATSEKTYQNSLKTIEMIRKSIVKKIVPKDKVTDYCFCCGYKYICGNEGK